MIGSDVRINHIQRSRIKEKLFLTGRRLAAVIIEQFGASPTPPPPPPVPEDLVQRAHPYNLIIGAASTAATSESATAAAVFITVATAVILFQSCHPRDIFPTESSFMR